MKNYDNQDKECLDTQLLSTVNGFGFVYNYFVWYFG